ncbi:hypothetical protein BH18ACT16_BH18ACT16_00830 [soil metagenome]
MAQAVSRAERGGSRLLWFGVLAGPVAWSLQILVGYNLEEIACNPGSQTQQLAGAEIEPVAVWLTLATGALALAGVLVSFNCWRRVRAAHDSTPGGRAEWMAWAGIVTSGLFSFWILLALFAPGFLAVCDPSL